MSGDLDATMIANLTAHVLGQMIAQGKADPSNKESMTRAGVIADEIAMEAWHMAQALVRQRGFPA